MNNKTAIIIPAHNEQRTIEQAIRQSKTYGDVIVINDFSTDSTSKIARNSGAKVINTDMNIGYGKSINRGLLITLNQNYLFAITIDADGEIPTKCISAIKERLEKFDEAVVIAQRNKLPRWGEQIGRFITKKLFNISDYFSGAKGYNLKYFKDEKIFRSDVDDINTYFLTRALSEQMKIGKTMYISELIKGRRSRFGLGIRVNLIMLKVLVLSIIKITNKSRQIHK